MRARPPTSCGAGRTLEQALLGASGRSVHGRPAADPRRSRGAAARHRALEHRHGDHLHRPRDVRGARPRPGAEVARAPQRQARVGHRHRVLRVSTVVGIGILALVVPTLIKQITAFITGIPSTIANFENSEFYALAGELLRRRAHGARRRGAEVPHEPRDDRRLLGRPAEGRRRHRDGDLRRPDRRRADALFRGVAPGDQGVAHPVRACAQPPEGGSHDR